MIRPLITVILLAGFARLGAAQPLASDQFLWGVCQVGGTGKNSAWPLTRSELETLRDDLHCNALRFFVHPGFIGLPQRTWNGPESIDYTRFTDKDYLWRDPSPAIDSLDEVLDLLYSVGLHPVLLILPVDEYVAYLSKDDLTFLNDTSKGLDYKGIKPSEQLKTLSVAVARHVREQYGPRFSVIYTEICGQGEGAPKRTRDRERWTEIVASIKAVAPEVTVYSPELCLGMWWWAAARPPALATGHSTPPFRQVPYEDTWPRGDKLENYRDAFDAVAVSYYGMSPDSIEWKDIASDQPALKAETDVTIGLARNYSRPKRWLWAEAGWGCEHKADQPFHLDRDLAALLFGMDHCGGALLWQGKDNEGSSAGVFTKEGKKAKGYDLLRAVSEVVHANGAFFAADHQLLNADGFPVADGAFRERDPEVLTRLLQHHIVLFSEAPVTRSITFTSTKGETLKEVPAGHGYSQPWPLDIRKNKGGAITVSRLRPRVLYLLERSK
ncbi:MAG: hypothetical protein HY318_11060 [Armatimonadetes bacterium]|nr:hypothetical protein [Armatimonadota bacterium]